MSQPELFPPEPLILTVSQLTANIKSTLEADFDDVHVTGEIGAVTRASSGHLYFSLKEKTVALIRCAIWKSTANRLRYQPEEGQEVVVRGKLNVYAPRGDYSLIVEDLQPKGRGAADLALRQLTEKLARAGFFASERKRPLPKFPQRLALVTSPTGAAVRDMLEILARRWPAAEVLICPVKVQGAGAAREITQALTRLNHLVGLDVILLGRGGGSAEDLSAFNDESVATAIFQSRIPVVAAIGHEIDVTIADLVADRRALTPSEAAELATPDRHELSRLLAARRQRLQELVQGLVERSRERWDGLAQRRVLMAPADHLRDLEQGLDEVEAKLRLAMKNRQVFWHNMLEGHAGRLHALSPLQVLARGYSLTRTVHDHRIIFGVGQVQAGEILEVLLSDGRLQAQVQLVQSGPIS